MNEPILITLRNGGKLKAIEEVLYDKDGCNVRYFGENGKYYYPTDIASVLPLDKGEQIDKRDLLSDKKRQRGVGKENRINAFVLLISVWRDSYRCFHQGI